MQSVAIKAEKRNPADKLSASRKAGKIPAVIYGGGVQENINVTHNAVKHLIFTPDFKIGELDVDGTKYNCIVKDIQWHPVTDEIRHIDFLAMKDGLKLKVELPVKFKGVSPGVKNGGKLMQSMRRVLVKLDPVDLVEELYVDISEVELGESVRVRDIELSDKIELMVNPAIPVASVEVPRALKSAEAEAEEAAAALLEDATAEGGEAAEPAEE